jgi:hypothetical protein
MAGWQFSALSDYARGAAPVTGQPFTMLIAATIDTLAASATLLFLGQAAASAQMFRVQIITSGVLQLNTINSTNDPAATTNVVTAGVPFIAVCRARSTSDRDVVLNGNLAAMGTGAVAKVPSGVDRMTFAKRDDTSNSTPFPGAISHAAIWKIAISDAALLALFAGRWPADVRPDNLVAFYPDFVARGGVIRDWCGKFHLTVNNGSPSGISMPRAWPQIARQAERRRAQSIVSVTA